MRTSFSITMINRALMKWKSTNQFKPRKKSINIYVSCNLKVIFSYLLDAWKDPLAMTNRVNNNPFLNWNPCPSVFVIFEGFILKGTTAKASLRMYRILKLQFILPLLKIKKFKEFKNIIKQDDVLKINRYL